MAKYIIKRLLLAVFILFGVSIILYALIRLMPVDIIESKFINANTDNVEEARAKIRLVLVQYGLDDSSFLGILKGYWTWLFNVFQGNLGVSFKFNADVSTVIVEHMGISFIISFIALIFEMIIAIPLGVKCACSQYGKLDYVITVLCMIGMAFPSFFLGNLFIKWFALDLRWFEIGGLTSLNLPTDASGFTRIMDTLWHMVLPMTVLVLLSVGSLMRYTRTNTLEVLNADYIRTARAKGLSEGKVVYKHVFRNTMIPLVTQLSFTLPSLFGGAMITEEVFAIPGIGQVAYQALAEGDIFLAMGYNMFIAILTVIGILLADLMYAVVDPRVKLAG